ncbi:glycine cleavage system protein H [Lacticigenium naphthae]|uniref:glycine cleavage system protein H n=1 Tax=Lacticigenium naphthae TaxID=515351 RepID=UPI00040D85A3|nr:glycine cleavage system protein H [Lacticigenium naphthae]
MSENKKFTRSGLWVEKRGGTVVIGLSPKAQDDIGEVMFAELPHERETITANETIMGVEGAKAVTELTAPVSGKVIRVHKEVLDNPELLNDPEPENNWIMELTEVVDADFEALQDEMPAIEV